MIKATDEFTVKQERGPDSTVAVRLETAANWQGSSKLVFTTDQKLTTGSGRAYAVRGAIKCYCNERGYSVRDGDFEAHSVEALYDPRHHSGLTTYRIEEQVREDERFQDAAAEVLQQHNALCQQYGEQIVHLKTLLAALERKQELLLKEMRAELIATQVKILGEYDIPPHVSDDDQRRLFEPTWPLVKIQMPYYAVARNGDLPNSLDEALALLGQE